MNGSKSAILRQCLIVIDEMFGVVPPPPKRRELLKSGLSDAELDIWKQVSNAETKAIGEERVAVEKSERQFFDILSKQFGVQTNEFFDDPDAQEAITELSKPENWLYDKDGNPTRPKPSVWNKYSGVAEEFFGKDLARRVKNNLTKSMKDIYRTVKKITQEDVLATPFRWTSTDKSSTDKLAKDTMFWVSDANGRHFEPAVAETSRGVMAQGLGFRETEDEMKKSLESTYKDKSDSYWFLMGNVAVQRARSFSKLSAFEDAGVTEYEIFAVVDNRTTPQCLYMNGRIFTVSNGQAIRDNTESSSTPEGVQDVYPWIKFSTSRASQGLDALYVNQGTDAKGNPNRVYLPSSNMKPGSPTQPVKGSITSGQKGTLNKLAPLPPYHGHCIVPGTPVLTLSGWKRIEDVVEGDYVLTHRGRYRMVTGTLQHLYTGTGISFSNEKGWAAFTSDHPFLFKDGEWKPGSEFLRSDDYEVAEDLPDLRESIRGLSEQRVDEILLKAVSSRREESKSNGAQGIYPGHSGVENSNLRDLRTELRDESLSPQAEEVEVLFSEVSKSRSRKEDREGVSNLRKENRNSSMQREGGARDILFDELPKQIKEGSPEAGIIQEENVREGESDVRKISDSSEAPKIQEPMAREFEAEKHLRVKICQGTCDSQCRIHLRTGEDEIRELHVCPGLLHPVAEALDRSEGVVEGEGRKEAGQFHSGSRSDCTHPGKGSHRTRRDSRSEIVSFDLERAMVFDLEVDEDESFVIGGGLIAHNCRTTYLITERAIQSLTKRMIDGRGMEHGS